MVSPFYLGSNPADDAQGQYPGKPISGGSNRFNPPPEFVDLTGDFEMMWEKAVGGLTAATLKLPEKFIEEEKKKWRSLFQITGGFDDYSESDPYLRELSGEPEQFYKATDFNIDLIQVFTDPKAQIKDVVTATFNRQDLSKEARHKLNEALVFGERSSSLGTGWEATLLDASIKSFETRFDAMQDRAGLSPGGGAGHVPLNLIDPSLDAIYHSKPGKTISGTPRNTYSNSAVDFGKAYIEFDLKSDSAKNYIAYRKFVGQAATSMDDLFTAPAPSGGVSRLDSSIDAALSSMGLVVGTTSYTSARSELYAAHDRFASMESANSSLSGFFSPKGAVGNANKALAVLETYRVVPGVPGVHVDVGSIATRDEVTKAEASLKGMAMPLAELAAHVEHVQNTYAAAGTSLSAREINRVNKWAAKTNSQITRLAKSVDPAMDATTLAGLHNSHVSGNAASTAALNAFADGFSNAAGDVGKRRKFATALSGFTSTISGESPLQTGLHTELAHMLVDHHILPGKNAGVSSIALALSEEKFGKQIQIYSLSARDTFAYNLVSNVVTLFDKGRIVPTLFSNRLFNALPQYTPHNIVKNFLISNHYFGLKVDADTMADYDAWILGGKSGQFSIFKRPGSAIVHRLSNSSTFGGLFENRFTIDAPSLGKIAAVGGIHFQGIRTLNVFRGRGNMATLDKMLNFPGASGTPGHVALLAEIHRLGSVYGLTENQAFIALMLHTKNRADFDAYFGHIPFASVDKIYDQMGRLRKWLKDNKIDVFDGSGDFDYTKFGTLEDLLQWFQARGHTKSYFDFTSRTIGLVQNLTQRLNVIQDSIFKRRIIGKLTIGNLFKWQEQAAALIRNRLLALVTRIGSKFAATFLTGAVAAGTGGLGAFLKPVLEKAIYFISVKVVGKLSNIVSDLLHGNFSAIGYAIQNSITFLFKVVAYVILILGFVIIGPLVFLNFLVSNMSPKAPYPYNNISAGNPITVLPGDDVVPGACPNKCLTQGGLSTTETSYEGDESYGHGSNNYWNYVENVLRKPTCNYTIPSLDYGGGYKPTASLDSADASVNRCIGEKPLSEESNFYGSAWDISIPGTGAAGKVICAPALGAVSYWITGTPTTDPDEGVGTRIELNGFDADDKLIYKLKYLHLDKDTVVSQDQTALPGDGIGTVWEWAGTPENSHVHLELMDMVTGLTVQPEDSGICLP